MLPRPLPEIDVARALRNGPDSFFACRFREGCDGLDPVSSRVVGEHLRAGIDGISAKHVVDLSVARSQHAIERGMRLCKPGIKALGGKPRIGVDGPDG